MEQLDIVKLIEKNSITRLSKDYENRLINKIKTNFTDSEQQLFVASFYCFLNYDTKKDFVIDFDTIWKWMGFSRKENAKRLLEKCFVIDVDYKIQQIVIETCIGDSQIGGTSFINLDSKAITPTPNGGADLSNVTTTFFSKEKIALTINTFKKFCLKARTDKADEIHDYYIKLEEFLHETINEQTNELTLQLKEKQQRVKLLENRILTKQKRVQYDGHNVIYMVQDEYHEKDRIFVVGKAKKLSDRLGDYNKTREHKVAYYRSCNSSKLMGLIETCVLYKLDKYREVSNRDRFVLPEGEDMSLFTNIIDLFVNAFHDVDPEVDIEKDLTSEEIISNKKESKKIYLEDNREMIAEKLKIYEEENKEFTSIRDKKYRDEHKEETSERNKQYREKNRIAILDGLKQYYAANKEKLAEKNKQYREEHKEVLYLYNKEYYKEHKEEHAYYGKKRYEENKDTVIEQSKKYYEEHKDDVLERTKERYKKNKTKILEYQQEKIICECGMQIGRNYMAKHKRTKIHQLSLENKLNGNELVKEDGKIVCECGAKITQSQITRHKNSKIHQIGLKVMLDKKSTELDDDEDIILSESEEDVDNNDEDM